MFRGQVTFYPPFPSCFDSQLFANNPYSLSPPLSSLLPAVPGDPGYDVEDTAHHLVLRNIRFPLQAEGPIVVGKISQVLFLAAVPSTSTCL